MRNFPSGVVTTEEPGRARNVRVPASKLTPGHPIRVSFRTARPQMAWTDCEYYCPTEEDKAILRRLELDPDNPSWTAVETRLFAAGFRPSELRELSGPALITSLADPGVRQGGPVYKPDGWTKAELLGQANEGDKLLGTTTFDTIRRKAKVAAAPKGGAGPHHKYSKADLRKMIIEIKSRAYRNQAAIARAWAELLDS